MMKNLLFLFLCPAFLCAAEANTVVATIDVGVTPASIAITPNNLYAYVANNNNYGIANSDTVSVLNLSNNTLQQTITDASFNQPYAVAINPAGTRVYVANSNSSTVTYINAATNAVLGTIPGFDGPSGFAITPDGLHAYVNNYGVGGGSGMGTTVRVVDLTTNMIVGPAITVGQAPAALAVTPDGRYVYVANYVTGTTGGGTVSVIQTSNNTVIATIPGFSGPFAVAITPDSKYVYVTNFGSNNFTPIGTTVSVISIASNTIVATINLGIQPAGIAITPDGSLAYVSNYNSLYTNNMFTDLIPGQGTVNIIDISTNTVIPPVIAVGQSPGAVAISPDGEFAYVTNFSSNTVSVIALQPFHITARGCKTENRFLTQRDSINKLTWTVSGTSLPVSYLIYRDFGLTDLAGIVNATQPFEFLDHNTQSNITYTYYVVGINAAGTTSDPVAVPITQNCGP